MKTNIYLVSFDNNDCFECGTAYYEVIAANTPEEAIEKVYDQMEGDFASNKLYWRNPLAELKFEGVILK